MDRFLNGLLVAICIVQEISSFDEHIYEPLSCLVTGIDLYVDEKKLSPLTSAQQIEFAEYQKQMADYERDVQKYEELMSQDDAGLPLPQPPPRPSFCNVPMVYLDGCVALADKLFVGNSFVRNLSADEQKKIGNFIEYSKKYEENQMRTLNGHDGSNGDINDMMNISNAELMDLFSVQMPENLNICTSL